MTSVVLVVKKTRYETADVRTRGLLLKKDPSVDGWREVHDSHMRTVEVVNSVLAKEGVSCTVVRDPYRAFDVKGNDMVIVVGGDGTFLAASHSVGTDVPMLGVNSDPKTSRGFFCGATSGSFAVALGMRQEVRVQRMQVSVNRSVRSKRVLNEVLLCHPHPAATSRFYVKFSDSEWEKIVSSGVWIGPPAGSTGAIRSAGGAVLPLTGSDLQFISRETISGETRQNVTSEPVLLRVKNDEAMAYMDGPYKYAALTLADEVELRVSDEPLTVLGMKRRR